MNKASQALIEDIELGSQGQLSLIHQQAGNGDNGARGIATEVSDVILPTRNRRKASAFVTSNSDDAILLIPGCGAAANGRSAQLGKSPGIRCQRAGGRCKGVARLAYIERSAITFMLSPYRIESGVGVKIIVM